MTTSSSVAGRHRCGTAAIFGAGAALELNANIAISMGESQRPATGLDRQVPRTWTCRNRNSGAG
jgi:hypothetical protein